ncbi:hypothetical protein BMS3Bbin03_02633 [bacterium BMS3Bbin03]|nr:hypothetical protein BMS3Bbin03_02633 [bacterium BMS3Bbin03]HDL78805.1 hypothetical protein [Bacteroidota bacterium]
MENLKNRIIIFILIAFVGLIACGKMPTKVMTYDNAKKQNFTITKLDYQDLPYTRNYTSSLKTDKDEDSSGVPLFLYHNKFYYHPVQIAQRSIELIDGYWHSNNKAYLKKAELLADKLIQIADTYDSILYFPYHFDFHLHGLPNQLMIAPWYSGMAQGQALSVFSRLYMFTKNQSYLDYATKLFKSFFRFKGEKTPWVVYIDPLGYYWIEEYPMETPCNTLNGYLFAIFGIYDYYLVTNDALSKDILLASLTTIKHYLPYLSKCKRYQLLLLKT